MADADAEVVDLQFPMRGRAVPHDYADALASAVCDVLPWIGGEALAGIHPLYGLSPGSHEWYLSRRSHLNLRVPACRVDDAGLLSGRRLQVSGAEVDVGRPVVRPLAFTPVVHARFVTLGELSSAAVAPDESAFFAACQHELDRLGLVPRALVCGKRQLAATSTGVLRGFSLMVDGLDAAGNRRLQQQGLGKGRLHGCGIFVPHKSMAGAETLE